MLKFLDPLTKEDLLEYFNGKKFETIDVNLENDENHEKDKFLYVEELKVKIDENIKKFDKKTILKKDALFSKIIFDQLKYFSRRELTDIRFWQYIGLEYLQNYI